MSDMEDATLSLSPDDIQLKIHATDWQDALKKASEPLLADGSIEPGYVLGMIDAVKRLGPYIVIAPGLALGHARPSGDVHRPCVAVATLDEPVEFGSEANDPVDIVIILAAVDDHAHLALLKKMVLFLNQANSFDNLRSATTSDDAQLLATSINQG